LDQSKDCGKEKDESKKGKMGNVSMFLGNPFNTYVKKLCWMPS
jgi:hypothetical protein